MSTSQNILLVWFQFSQRRNQHGKTHIESNRQDVIYLYIDLFVSSRYPVLKLLVIYYIFFKGKVF